MALLPVPVLLLAALAQGDGVAPPAPLPPVPSKAQLERQKLETCAFIHFGMNTFTGREWGTGQEEEALFAPAMLDCMQWARVCAEAGLQGIVLTAKHHDGFCLWPTETTAHSVRSSPWRQGRGDVLGELAAACRATGLKLGVYVSPWDRNAPVYGSPAYNDFFQRQLREVLTGYGPLFEVWFDGANGEGPNGRRQVYDWPAFFGLVQELQPNAVIFSDGGPGVRWVGNERGYAAETNWCMLRREEFAPGKADTAALMTGHEDGTAWLPAEADVSIRPGWFWHREQDAQVKSVDALLDIWYGSVGRNALLLLNVPVNRDGRIPDGDAERLREWRRVLDATFHHDLAREARASASNVRGGAARFAAARATDGRPGTYWAADDGVTSAELRLELPRPEVLNRVLLREYVPLGQRIRSFRVAARVGGTWQELARGTTVGMRRVLRTPAVRTEAVRIIIEDARACPTLREVGLFAAPARVSVEPAGGLFLERARVELRADLPDAEIRYRLDGRDPKLQDPLYSGPLLLDRSVSLAARAFRNRQPSVRVTRARIRVLTAAELEPARRHAGKLEPGLRWRSLEGGFQSVRELLRGRPAASGVAPAPDASLRSRPADCGLVFEGFVKVPADAIYTFATRSDDGSALWVDGRQVVDNDGFHGRQERRGQIGLHAGLHFLRLAWFNGKGDAGLEVLWSGPDGSLQALDPAVLWHSAK